MQELLNYFFYWSVAVSIIFSVIVFFKLGSQNKTLVTHLKINLFVWYVITLILMVLR